MPSILKAFTSTARTTSSKPAYPFGLVAALNRSPSTKLLMSLFSKLLWGLRQSSLANIICTSPFPLCVISLTLRVTCSGDTDITAFVQFSAMVETVGTSAYNGAAQLIHNKVHIPVTVTFPLFDADSCYSGLPHCSGFHLGY